MKLFFKKLHHYAYNGIVLFIFILLYPVLYFVSYKKRDFTAINRCRKILGVVSSYLTGIIFKIEYETPVDWSNTYIICPNHTSSLDIAAIVVLSKATISFMGKHDLLNNPVTRTYFKTIDVAVDRSSKMSSFRAFKKAESYLQTGISMIIFPEGKIADDFPPVLHPFKNGPFRLAIEQNIPILPVTLIDNWKLMFDDGTKYGSRPGFSHIFVHTPIMVDGLTINDTDILKEKVHSVINSKFNESRS